MKILYLSDVFFPRVNGVSTSIATFMAELRKLGHEVHLVAPAYGDEPALEGLHRVRGWTVPFDPEDRIMGFRAMLRTTHELLKDDFDLIHIQTPFVAHRVGVRVAKQTGLPVVETYHTYFQEYLFHYVPFAPRFLMRALARSLSRSQCNRVDAVVVPSRAMEGALRDYGVDNRMERIPTGLRPEDFEHGDGVAFRAKHGIAPDRPTLVHIGRVAFEKNIDFLLRVLKRVSSQVPDVMLVIAGEGPALGSLRKQTQTLKLEDRVKFVGYLDRGGELMDCYRAADAFIFASRTETQGLVLLESMALGVPVVSTSIMGTRDILELEKGALVAKEDEEDFARQVVRLLSDGDLHAQKSREARAYALGEWDAATMARRLSAVYEDLTAAHRRRGKTP
ncbi:MAG: glycosyltransferase [Acidobacteriota bacterium]